MATAELDDWGFGDDDNAVAVAAREPREDLRPATSEPGSDEVQQQHDALSRRTAGLTVSFGLVLQLIWIAAIIAWTWRLIAG